MPTKKIQIIGSMTPDLATDDKNGLMSATDKAKLDTVEKGAQVNVQPDWNQNDETKDDYIKNRTHYEIEKKNEVLVDNITIDTFAKDGDNDWYVCADNPFELDLSLGDTYTVVFDGIEYECTCEAHRMYIYDATDASVVKKVSTVGSIGNIQPLLLDAECAYADLQFCITLGYKRDVDDSVVLNIFVYNNMNTTHTISIINTTSVFQRIPYEYMPNEIMGLKSGSGTLSIALGYPRLANVASGDGAFAAGRMTVASGNYAQTEGAGTIAQGTCAHAEGFASIASGNYSHAEGQSTIASGVHSHTEGIETTASGKFSHAEGQETEASGACSHTEGNKSIASGGASHAEGQRTVASGHVSHAEGNDSVADGFGSHAEGYYTIANGRYQHVHGQYNIADASDAVVIGGTNYGKYIHIVGNGTAEDARSNAHTLDWSGNGWYAGGLRVGGTSYDDGNEVTLYSPEGAIETVGCTNQIPISIDNDGNIYNSTGYKNGIRWSSSGGAETTSNANGMGITGYIPCKSGDTLRLKNVTFPTNSYIIYFDANKSCLGIISSFGNPDSTGVYTIVVGAYSNVAFIRLTLGTLDKYSMATINEDIVVGGTFSTGWLENNDGEKIAPNTYISQVLNEDGSLYSNVVNAKITEAKSYTDTEVAKKQNTITGGASTITSSNLTASRALVSDGAGKVTVSEVTSTELGYLDGVTSAVQTQLNNKVPTSRTVNGKALTSNISLVASDVGLGNVNNTSDANKPVSTAQKTAIDSSLNSAKSYTDTALANYYTKTEIDNMEFITVADIDAICGTTIEVASASEVTF